MNLHHVHGRQYHLHFPTMMVCMMAWRPIQALMAISATFKMLESSSQKFLQGLVYLIGNLMGLALAVYKCQSMGLLPTHASDWLAFIEPLREWNSVEEDYFCEPEKESTMLMDLICILSC